MRESSITKFFDRDNFLELQQAFFDADAELTAAKKAKDTGRLKLAKKEQSKAKSNYETEKTKRDAFRKKVITDLSTAVKVLLANVDSETGLPFFLEIDFFDEKNAAGNVVKGGSLLILGLSPNVRKAFKSNYKNKRDRKTNIAYGMLHLDSQNVLHLLPEQIGRGVKVSTFLPAVKAEPVTKSGMIFWNARRKNNVIFANDFVLPEQTTDDDFSNDGMGQISHLTYLLYNDLATKKEKAYKKATALKNSNDPKEAYQVLLALLNEYDEWKSLYDEALKGAQSSTDIKNALKLFKTTQADIYRRLEILNRLASEAVEDATDIGETDLEDDELEALQLEFEKQLVGIYNQIESARKNQATDPKAVNRAKKALGEWLRSVENSPLNPIKFPKRKQAIVDFVRINSGDISRVINIEKLLANMAPIEQYLNGVPENFDSPKYYKICVRWWTLYSGLPKPAKIIKQKAFAKYESIANEMQTRKELVKGIVDQNAVGGFYYWQHFKDKKLKEGDAPTAVYQEILHLQERMDAVQFSETHKKKYQKVNDWLTHLEQLIELIEGPSGYNFWRKSHRTWIQNKEATIENYTTYVAAITELIQQMDTTELAKEVYPIEYNDLTSWLEELEQYKPVEEGN